MAFPLSAKCWESPAVDHVVTPAGMKMRPIRRKIMAEMVVAGGGRGERIGRGRLWTGKLRGMERERRGDLAGEVGEDERREERGRNGRTDGRLGRLGAEG